MSIFARREWESVPGQLGRKVAGKSGHLVTTGLRAGRKNTAKPATQVTTGFLPGKTSRAAQDLGKRLRSLIGELIAQELEPGPERDGDLAGSGGRPRVRGRLPERPAVRAQTARSHHRRKRGSIIETLPGEECQVDYGTGPMVRDPETGKYRRTRLFVMTLGYSRKSVRLLTFRSSSRIWAELHEKAFRRLGGCPRSSFSIIFAKAFWLPTSTIPV